MRVIHSRGMFGPRGTVAPRVVFLLVCDTIFTINSKSKLFLLIHAPPMLNAPKTPLADRWMR